MKYSAAITALALASTAIATPTANPPSNPPSSGACSSSGQKQVCCNGLLTCLVQVLGTDCNSGAYCCNTSAPVGALLNIALLNCLVL